MTVIVLWQVYLLQILLHSAAARQWQSTWRYLAHWWMHSSSFCKDMTGVSYHCYVYQYLHTQALLGQGTITDTSKYTHYLATTCLSFIFQTWLSQEHTRLTVIPVNLTVPAHLHCSHTPDISLAVTAGHNLSQAVTTRWNQSHTVISFWWHEGDSTLLGLHKVFWMCKHGWMCCPHAWRGKLDKGGKKSPTLLVSRSSENEVKFLDSIW